LGIVGTDGTASFVDTINIFTNLASMLDLSNCCPSREYWSALKETLIRATKAGAPLGENASGWIAAVSQRCSWYGPSSV